MNMSPRQVIKKITEHIPFGIGRWLAHVPFSWRLGSVYVRMKEDCSRAIAWSDLDQERYSVEKFRKVFEYAREHFPCYRELYERAGVLDLSVKSFTDIAKVPIIDKAWVRNNFMEFKGAYKLFSGGTTGTPTPFWMDKDCWAREWAHMHWIWSQLGYNYTDLKATLRGKNMGENPFEYNPVHNEFRLNTYLPVSKWKGMLLELFGKRKIKFFHPFPSSMHEFILDCEQTLTEEEQAVVFGNIKGLLLSSEYPAPHMIERYRKHNLPYVSWYGHSEMCVLAYDLSGAKVGDFANRYVPFTTYGLCEVEEGEIVGTSFHNFDMPLIRYKTGDMVELTKATKGGLCREFSIKEGRAGDYVLDRNGRQVSLTALIYGRYHKAFDVVECVQVGQLEPGKATLYVTAKDRSVLEDLDNLFDLTNVDVDFDVKVLDKPIRTAMGKLKLRV